MPPVYAPMSADNHTHLQKRISAIGVEIVSAAVIIELARKSVYEIYRNKRTQNIRRR